MINDEVYYYAERSFSIPILCYNTAIMSAKPKLNVHKFPRPPLLEQISRHLVIKWGGETVAETKEAYWALETTVGHGKDHVA